MRGILAAKGGVLLTGVLVFALMGVAQSVYGPALPAFARQFDLPAGEAGAVVSAHWAGAALGVAAMFFSDGRVPPRVALAVSAAGAGLLAAGLGWWGVLAGAAAIGAGFGVLTTHFNRRVIAEFGPRGPGMLSFLNAVFGMGAIAAPLAWLALGRSAGPAFLVLTMVMVALLPLLRAPAAPAGPNACGGARAPDRFVPRWGILGLGALGIGVEASLVGLGPLALIALGQGEAEAAASLSMFFLAFLGARLALALGAGLLPPFSWFTLALAGSGVLALALALTGAAWLFVPLGACAGAIFPPFYVAAAQQMGEHPRVAPTIIAAGLAGGIAAPVLAGQLMARAGEGILFGLVAGVALAAAAAALARRRAM